MIFSELQVRHIAETADELGIPFFLSLCMILTLGKAQSLRMDTKTLAESLVLDYATMISILVKVNGNLYTKEISDEEYRAVRENADLGGLLSAISGTDTISNTDVLAFKRACEDVSEMRDKLGADGLSKFMLVFQQEIKFAASLFKVKK